MNVKSSSIDQRQFEEAIRRFDEENSRDPNVTVRDGRSFPREVLYARWLGEWVQKLAPDASDALRLAARCQHLCRWTIPRDSYPQTRAGYLRWREALKQFHAKKAGEILQAIGCPETLVERVRNLNLKKDFPNDPEGRVLEDALCLVFLEHQLTELAEKTSDEKMINALRKSWEKMTEAGRAEALKLAYGEREQVLLKQALNAVKGG